MELKEIFENHIKIEAKVMAIETLFNNPSRLEKTNYEPPYQRNYVWDDEKATYFIESILIGTEIPPLIFFSNSNTTEVIDGRQRYQTILRFIKNEFKLKKNGLQKLDDLSNKSFKDLKELKDIFWETKLRIIVFSFHSKNLINEENEDKIKKEIFKRYNSGITPLKPTDIDKAVYFDDDLNTFIKRKLQKDKVLYGDIADLFYFEKSSFEILLKKIRQLLVIHKIPIKYYAIKKDTVISRYYEFLFSNLNDTDIEAIFNGFVEKINILKKVQRSFKNKGYTENRLIFEGIFWALSIIEGEGIKLTHIKIEFIEAITEYINREIDKYELDRSSFSRQLLDRYTTTALFFKKQFHVDFDIYIQNSAKFKSSDKNVTSKVKERTSFDQLRINKPEPSSITILDIVRQMEKQRFMIRPPYQRDEVINKKKSSAIIESILLGIKIPPIFVFKREDGVSEVLDGQQRLLSLLGFIQKKYLDENNKLRSSDKDGYALYLKDGILGNLHTKKFNQLSPEFKEKIEEYDLWIIEISEKNNNNFEPIDLFIRLNYKPYPIKENTFEMWNSYIDRLVINKIRNVHAKYNDWFYIRKNNSRMENENVYTFLAYLQYKSKDSNSITISSLSKDLDSYKTLDKINFRIKSKTEITKVLEDANVTKEFLSACDDLDNSFIEKVKNLVEDVDDDSTATLNANLEYIFNVENRRTQQNFYALWFFLINVNNKKIITEKRSIRDDLKALFKTMNHVTMKSHFDDKVESFWEKYK